MTLGEYLKWALVQPWGWGVNPGLDCCKFAGKWAICCGYVDPMVGGGTKDFAPYVLMVVALMIRPYGMFGTRRIERV